MEEVLKDVKKLIRKLKQWVLTRYAGCYQDILCMEHSEIEVSMSSCVCGNKVEWDCYHGLNERLYVYCKECGQDYDFQLLLEHALKHGVKYKEITRQYISDE